MNAVLTGLSHIAIEGDDALAWLQNLITADIESQDIGTATGAALLSPQGKILFDFMVLKDDCQKLSLEVRADIAAALVQRLTLYKLRAKLTVGAPQDVVIAINDQSGTWRDMRFGVPVWRSLAAGNAINRMEYDALRIDHGVAESLLDYALGDALPHDVNLDQISGVGFRKGCYVGQEVVSRMQHRGTARRRMVVAKGEHKLPVAGTLVLAGDREIGALGTVAGNRALAIIRLDKADGAKVPVTAAGAVLSFSLPIGATFSLRPDAKHG
jgi:tRNA-modifying protein YgfZ